MINNKILINQKLHFVTKQCLLTNNEISINQKWRLTNDHLDYSKGKICRVHSTGNKIEAYWLDDCWNPLIIGKDKFLETFDYHSKY